ncbi:MAG: hypothetical protein KKH98_12735 [Spirochaetes bacterium]|nr:hypothetical protein [Spirochaetota bacterium]
MGKSELTKKYIFLLGRPGCGKSAVYNKLIDHLKEEGLAEEFPRVDDFPKLWAKFMQDDKNEKEGKQRAYSRKTDDGGYKVVNDMMWHELLKEVNEDIIPLKKTGRIVFVEFSRDSYHSAFNNFSPDVLDHALALYIDVPFEICWKRNVARHEKAISEGSDDHLVSKEEMEKTYKIDDGLTFAKNAPLPVEVIDNSQNGEDFLDEQIRKIIIILKEKYTYNL